MPRYEITAPDGSRYEVTAPDGASEADVMAYAQSQFKPKEAPPTGAQALAKETGAGEAFVVGAGRAADRVWQGGKQAMMGIGGILSEALPQGLKTRAQDALTQSLLAQERTEAQKTAAYDPLQRERPIATLGGEVAALMGAPILRPFSGVGAGTAVANTAVSAALPGLMEYGNAKERGVRGAIGAAGGTAGAALGNAVGRVAQPVRNAPTQTQQAAQEAAERLGVNLSAGEQSASRPVKWAESALADLPFSAGMEQGRQKANALAMNQAAARSIGQNADEITPAVLSTARSTIGAQFDSLLSTRQIPLDATFQAEVKNITGSKVMKELRDEGVEAILEPFRNLPPGKISVAGDWFQQNKTALDAAIRTAYTAGENGKAKALEGLERALNGAATRSMDASEKAAYGAAQKQWASLRMLETGQVVKDGRVMPSALDAAMKNRYKAAYREGKLTGDLPDIAALASTLRPMPNSGTAPRAIYSGMAGGAAFAEPMTAAVMMSAPPAIQAFLQSSAGKKYLTQGLFGVTPTIEDLMMRGAGGLLGAGSLAVAN